MLADPAERAERGPQALHRVVMDLANPVPVVIPSPLPLAATWADQRDALADLRGSLRDMVSNSPLTNAATYVKHLEAAYRSA